MNSAARASLFTSPVADAPSGQSISLRQLSNKALMDPGARSSAPRLAGAYSDPDLASIERLQAGDSSSLDLLMRRHQEALHRFVFRYTNNEEDSADLVQETFVRVFRKVDSYLPRASVKTWIYTIALNLCRDRARRARRLKWIPFLRACGDDERGLTPEDTVPAACDDPSAEASYHEVGDAIASAITKLPEKFRIPFTICVLEDHSHAEAAEILRVTPKTIELRIYRARQQLRAALGPVLDGHNFS